MNLNQAIKLKLKCSKFMTTSEHCNDNTLFIVFETTYRTHTVYLILNFIYKKYSGNKKNKYVSNNRNIIYNIIICSDVAY